MSRGGPPTIDRDRLLTLFRHMVDVYSPSGKEEELGSFLATFIPRPGLDVWRQPVEDGRFNLLIGTESAAPEILFLGHIDTVPAFDIERYDFSLRDGVCYGLGTADMKGGCAAMVEAFLTAAESGFLPQSVLLGLTVGEEETGDGTQALLQEYRFREALVAEPTDLAPCLDHFGYVEMDIRAFGYRRHAAVSGGDTNAIRALLHVLLQLEEYIEREAPEVVLNIRDLHSSESGFAVPDRCSALVDFHTPPTMEIRSLSERVRGFVEDALEASRTTRHEIVFPTLANGFRTDPGGVIPVRLKQAFSERNWVWSTDSFRSHSDANLLHEAGCAALVFGPGQLAKAHTRDESVRAETVIAAAELYTSVLKGWV